MMDFKEFTTRAEQDIRAALEDASPGVGVGMNQVEKLQGDIGKFENELTQLAEPTEEEIRQMREKIEEAQKEKSRAYHRNYSKEYRAKNLEKRREYERIKAREYRAKRKAQAAALPVS